MIITNLPYLEIVEDRSKVTGGKQNNSYESRAVSLAYSYANGSKSYAVTGTSVYLDRGISQSNSFAVAQSQE